MSAFLRPSLPILFFLFLAFQSNGQDCGCLNCPLPIANNSTQQSFLSVQVDGSNDLGDCPLTKVCFTINHTWVGDLSVTLTSPSGLNYLLMADLDNDTGGCGNDENNIDVCIVPGDTLALSGNTEYICNGNVPFEPCLLGEWNVPCGGVNDPITGALEAPNCTLDDFNVPGDPANGVWILTVNDICMQDIGVLIDWHLEFGCGISSCDDCFADGGTLDLTEASGCEGSADLNLTIVPDQGPNPPDPTSFGYVFLISQNDTILVVDTLVDLSGYPAGIYEVCGLSYDLSEADSLLNLPGTTLSEVQLDTILCLDLSDTCATVTVLPVPAVTVLEATLCDGECYTGPDGTVCCGQDTCLFTLPAFNGCDSLIQVNITFLPPIETFIDTTVCLGECIALDTFTYCATGSYSLVFPAFNGCDSVVFLNLEVVDAAATVAPPDTITCDNPSVLLDGSASLGSTFIWYDENGTQLIDSTQLEVSAGGCYTLVASGTGNGLLCADSVTVCVEDVAFVPSTPVLSGGVAQACFGDTLTYVVQADSSANNYLWSIPPGLTQLDGGDGFPFVTLLASAAIQGNVCVEAENGCGLSPVACASLEVVPELLIPAILGPAIVCEGDLTTYCIDDFSTATGFEWVVTGGVIQSLPGTNCIEVAWGQTAGTVCLTSSNPCDTSAQVCVPVAVTPLVEPPLVGGPTQVCEGDTAVYQLTAGAQVTNIEWAVPANATIIGGGDGLDSLVVLWNAGGSSNICATVSNSCSQASGCVAVVTSAAVATPAPTGPAAICQGGVAIVCTPFDFAALDYVWSVPAGVSILAGQGTECVQLEWDISLGGSVCVTTSNGCGPSATVCWDISITPAPQAGTISGSAATCAGDTSIYTISALSDALDYVWTIPASATLIAGGNGDTTATVIWNGLATENICVTAEGICGPGTASCLTVSIETPPTVLAISGDAVPCQGDTLVYCVTPFDTLADSYAWVVPPGAVLVGGQGSACAEIVFTTAGLGEVCVSASNACGGSVEVCLGVDVLSQPLPPQISGSSAGCVGDTVTFTAVADPGTPDFNWILPANAALIDGGGNFDFVTLVWTQPGAVEVCAAGQNSCGSSAPACLSVTVTTVPEALGLSGPDTVCLGAISVYCVNADPNASSYFWEAPAGAQIVSGQGTTCVEVAWSAGPGGAVCVTAQGTCGVSNSACLPVTVFEIPNNLIIAGPVDVCAGDTAWYALSGMTFATTVDWQVPACGIVLQQTGVDSIQIVWPSGCGQVTLCATGSNLCGTGAQSCVDIQVSEIPAPVLVIDAEVCDTVVNLVATNTIGSGVWSVLSGPGAATILDASAPSTQMAISAFGIYNVSWVENNNGCQTEALATILFNEPLSVGSTLVESCDYVQGEYTVTFSIVGGDPPYAVSGTAPGMLAGNTFISSPIPSTVPYSFTISNGICDDLVVQGVVTCVCTSDAGTMDQDLLEVCEADSVFAAPADLPMLDPEDILQYVLHDGPFSALGNIFAISDNPVFSLQPGMSSGQTYYISAVVGDELNGQIDLNDPCLSVAAGTPVVFLTAPAGVFVHDGLVCEGDPLEVPLSFTGTGPFNVAVNGNIYVGLSNTDTLILNIVQDGWIYLDILSDGNGCASALSDSLLLTQVMPPQATVVPQVSVCNTPASGMEETFLDFNELILGGDAGGIWIDEDTIGLIPPFWVFDFVYQDTGLYQFTYVTNSAVGPCEEQSYPVTVLVEACDCPPLEVVAQDSFCRLEGQFDLANLILNADPGVWTITGFPAGATQFPALNGSLLEAIGSDPGTYELTYTLVQDPVPGCAIATTVLFTIQQEAEAGDPETILEFCEGENVELALFDYVNASAMGVWEDLSSIPITGGAFDPVAGTFALVDQLPGAYVFQYTVQGATPCEDDISTILVDIQAPPVAEAAGVVTEISCLNETLSLGGTGTTTGPSITYDWVSAEGNPLEDPAQANIIVGLPGLYFLTVTDTATGCFAVDSVQVTYSNNWPEVGASSVAPGCPDGSDGSIFIENQQGGVPPFLYGLSDGALLPADTFFGLAPGVYQVYWEDAQGCTGQLEVEVPNKQPFDVDILADFPEDPVLPFGDSVQLSIQVNPFTNLYQGIFWTPSTFLTCDTCLSTIASPFESTEYFAQILVDGCLYQTSFKLVVEAVDEIPQPNIFSPDGDGDNDFFTIYGGNEIDQVLTLQVYSRWGELIYRQDDFPPNLANFGWDGMHRGEPAAAGVYVWYAELLLVNGERKVIKGDVALVR